MRGAVLSLVLAFAVVGSGVAAAAPARPAPSDRLQWQLGDLPADLSVDAEVYDLDLFETTRAEVARLHTEAGKAVFIVEYEGTTDTLCGRERRGTSVQRKHLRLDAWAQRCPYRTSGA